MGFDLSFEWKHVKKLTFWRKRLTFLGNGLGRTHHSTCVRTCLWISQSRSQIIKIQNIFMTVAWLDISLVSVWYDCTNHEHIKHKNVLILNKEIPARTDHADRRRLCTRSYGIHLHAESKLFLLQFICFFVDKERRKWKCR